MNSEFKLPLNRQTWPIIVGMLVTFVLGTMYCVISIGSGPLGNSKGVLLFGFVVGNDSRYWDPLLLGVLAGFVTYCWRKIPPVRPYCWINRLNNDQVAFGVLFTGLGMISGAFLLYGYFESYNISGFLMILLISTVFTPFGMRGATVPLVFGVLDCMVVYGSVPVVLFVSSVYFGKWINWWVVNIIRHGFKGAKSALKSSNEAGAVVQQS